MAKMKHLHALLSLMNPVDHAIDVGFTPVENVAEFRSFGFS
jgi:hypothetical protein